MFFVDIPCCPYACCDRLCGLASAFGFASFVEQEVIRTQSQVIVGVLKLALKRVKRRVKNSGRRQAESCRYVYTIGCLPHQEEANVAPRMLLGASQVRGLGAWKKPGDFLAKKKTTGPIGQMVFLSRKPFLMSSLRFFLLEMVEVAGVEPASLVLSYVASTCLAFNLLSLLNRLNASYSVSRLPKYN